jgi:hypothetical protein
VDQDLLDQSELVDQNMAVHGVDQLDLVLVLEEHIQQTKVDILPLIHHLNMDAHLENVIDHAYFFHLIFINNKKSFIIIKTN